MSQPYIAEICVERNPSLYVKAQDDSTWLTPATGMGNVSVYKCENPGQPGTGTVFAFPIVPGVDVAIRLYVRLGVPSAMTTIGSIPPKLSATGDGIVFNFQSSGLNNGSSHIDYAIDVIRNVQSATTPFSSRESILWTLQPNGGDSIAIATTTPLEAYAIYPSQPTFIVKDGIPIELLRLFIPASLTTDISTEEQWITWVARVCHGTQDPKQSYGTLRTDSTQHWLRYQIWNGGHSFIAEDGGTFKLSAWVDAYTHFKGNPAWLTTVNCFDQAGIVEVVLGFGIDNLLLWWEVKKPFGYIDADLVGWGRTNSPFFEGDGSRMNVTPSNDPERTPFRSHVFVTITPIQDYSQEMAKVVDACAGPVHGDLNYADYLKKRALQDGDPELLKGSGSEASNKRGVNAAAKTGKASTLKVLMRDQFPGVPAHITEAITDISNAFASTPVVSANFSPSVAIDTFLNPILTLIDDTNGKPIFTEQAENKIAPVTTQDPAGITYERKLVCIVNDYSRLKLNATPTFLSVQIGVYSDLAGATEGLNNRFSLFAVTPDWQGKGLVNVKDTSSDAVDASAKITDTRIKVFGNRHLSVFVYKNLLVQISGNSVRSYIPGWTATMVTQLAAY